MRQVKVKTKAKVEIGAIRRFFSTFSCFYLYLFSYLPVLTYLFLFRAGRAHLSYIDKGYSPSGDLRQDPVPFLDAFVLH